MSVTAVLSLSDVYKHVMSHFSPPGCRFLRGLQSSGGAGGQRTERGAAAAEVPPAQEAAGPVLPGSGLRAGAALQAAAVPVRPRERPPGRRAQAHPDPGQDLVPEPEVQVQAAEAGPEPGDGVSAAAPQGVGAGVSAGREAMSGGGRSRLQPTLLCGPHQPLHLQQLPGVRQLPQPGMQLELCVRFPRRPRTESAGSRQQLHDLWGRRDEQCAELLLRERCAFTTRHQDVVESNHHCMRCIQRLTSECFCSATSSDGGCLWCHRVGTK